jgi:hypothetical protein
MPRGDAEVDRRETARATREDATSRVRTRRLRAIAAVLEKVAIFVAMALLTYALIVVDTRAATPNAPPTITATSCDRFAAGPSDLTGRE